MGTELERSAYLATPLSCCFDRTRPSVEIGREVRETREPLIQLDLCLARQILDAQLACRTSSNTAEDGGKRTNTVQDKSSNEHCELLGFTAYILFSQ